MAVVVDVTVPIGVINFAISPEIYLEILSWRLICPDFNRMATKINLLGNDLFWNLEKFEGTEERIRDLKLLRI